MPQQPYRQQTAQGRTQRIASGLQAHRQAAPAFAGIFTGNHIAAGQDATNAQPSQTTQQRQLQRALAKC
ncbi:hypothetical protein D3C72_2107410 [compost metagenome]